jgi:hypothetical protein
VSESPENARPEDAKPAEPAPPAAPPGDGTAPPGDGATPPGDGATPPAPAPQAAEPPAPPAAPIDPVEELRKRGKSVELAALLSFLVPGMGHVYLGKSGKGLVAFVLIVGLFVSGLWLSGGEAVWLDKEYGHPWAFCAQVGAGIPAGVGLLRSHAYEVKTALGIKSEPPPPPPTIWQTPEYVRELPHQDEGLLFTMVAGLLNLLLIHDAFCGAPGASAAREEDEDDDEDDDEEASTWSR